MTFDEFVAKYNGQGVDTDGAYGNQCMDLMHKYIVDVLGLDLSLFAAPTAYQAYQNANDDRFDKIANSPTGVPQKGDIIFWDTSIGSAGHVAIFISGDTSNFTSFDQNWPTGSTCHTQAHTYSGVTGWLHPKQEQTVSVDQTTFTKLVNNSNVADAVCDNLSLPRQSNKDSVIASISQLRSDRDSSQNDAKTKQTMIDQLDGQVADLNQKLTEATSALQEAQKPVLVQPDTPQTPSSTVTFTLPPAPSTETQSWLLKLIAWIKQLFN